MDRTVGSRCAVTPALGVCIRVGSILTVPSGSQPNSRHADVLVGGVFKPEKAATSARCMCTVSKQGVSEVWTLPSHALRHPIIKNYGVDLSCFTIHHHGHKLCHERWSRLCIGPHGQYSVCPDHAQSLPRSCCTTQKVCTDVIDLPSFPLERNRHKALLLPTTSTQNAHTRELDAVSWPGCDGCACTRVGSSCLLWVCLSPQGDSSTGRQCARCPHTHTQQREMLFSKNPKKMSRWPVSAM
jgi:hypothetical protein